MTEFWNWWVIIIVAINILGCWGLLYWTRRIKESEEGETTGHVYDGIEEYNNPLPRWWLNMFYITLVFSIGYLVLYPGLGNFKGTLEWSMEGQHNNEVESAKRLYQPLFDKYADVPIAELAKIKQATEMGKRIFVNTCFGCHGSDARGNPGYPNLTDKDWLWGGSPEQLKHSIVNGRIGAMPPFGANLTASQVDELVNYVGQLSGNKVDEAKAAAGKATFDVQCFVCHGTDGKGNTSVGAPNLTDNIWLHGASKTAIADTIRNGRTGEMPPHKDILGDAKSHLVAAYVYSLSNQ
ncbi:cytochrome-c oxidase, cbb3-type subunit III [Aliikangiella coralliicola]|uniref:Cbb3-type cytochrome c oxidase subunit n=1 Tax=Aliikangiella coralliicola TaxID=2592383 RepID=A0A545UDF7_9GAMM|nr:cytochrome-c oxidase, cbb3-type subunit III [Aliikangiella coralliicola]TQV87497.1 cytochrome-c oxidase, cbb3-type subunit III [Aliikangiella coralliicola]